jgi:hypothetical protein
VYGRVAGRRDVRLYTLDVATSTDFLSAIFRRLDIRDHVTEYERLLELARRLEEQPCVFLLPLGASVPGEITNAAEALLDAVDKVGGAVRPTFVFVLSSLLGVSGLPDDFTTGWPVACEPGEVGRHPSESWCAYLHLRLAWETAGNLHRAERWNTVYRIERLPDGEDQFLEQALNRAAADAYKDVPEETRQQIETHLAESSNIERAGQSLWQPWDELQQWGLVWLTPGTQVPGPSPWFARALLLRGAKGPVRNLLRNSLVCAPLSRQVLSACFDLEAHERARCAADLPDESQASRDTLQSYHRFQRGDENSEAAFYTEDCPARPDDVWHFAAWGEIIERMRPSSTGSRTYSRHKLRVLRNALSHGHYVSWCMLCRLREVRRELGLEPMV